MHILIADDEPIVRRGLRAVCESSGLATAVWEACDGHRVLELLSRETVDVAFLDVCMPCMGGLDALEQVPPDRRPAVIVIVSGYGEFGYAQRAIRIGVMEYLLKPAGAAEIRDVLARSVERIARTEAGVCVASTDGQDVVAQAVHYIESRVSERLRLQDVAAAIHVSPTYLAALFKKKMQLTFLEYVHLRKVEAAAALLRKGLRVVDAAHSVGFEDVRHFCDIFERHMGVHPRSYLQDSAAMGRAAKAT
ncbi:response regulator [Alicyclobacillus mali]|uniref:Response regulator n=1 Tax=Alicyclobacillus mali (ex Roth et al. 2021) TaxID=1123961 RepID=A0ABS0F6U5_9BACL|nr:response regulator [Alicyclobacillus mali (ex Roth et al. 2021)]MBF8379012.1 response regulator [Alicyclobacillus mali (ex Roth et al. 2021)]MCL6488627.1 response regulator [Alicyclobacillus mali (ex Roth et al. 2021)]